MIIHLNGWPGAGKKTVGIALAAQIGGRFIHNHLLHDVALVCAGKGSDDYWSVYEQVRSAAYGALARKPQSESFVMTNALCRNSAVEVTAWNHVVELAIARAVPLVPIILDVAPEENARRVQSDERRGNKLSDLNVLFGYFDVDQIQCPDVPETLRLDTTALHRDEAAQQIAMHIEAIRPRLRPATKRHLAFR